MLELEIEKENHAIFNIRGGGGRNLVVVDDFWVDACDYASASEEVKEDILYDLQSRVGSASASGLANLLSLASGLDSIGKIIIGDFVEQGTELGWISNYLENIQDNAFLIDVNDSSEGRPAPVLKGGELAAQIIKAGVPKFRLCYFTVMMNPTLSLTSITKKDIADGKVNKLKEWWSGAFGGIDKTLFDKKTGREVRFSPAPHDPDNLSQEYLEKDEFFDFLNRLSERGGYGVWDCLMERIEKIDSLEINKLDYLCAKSFLGYPDESTFPYTALRALVYGLSVGLLDVKVVEDIGAVPEDLGYEFCWGSVSLPNPSTEFSEFAERLRNFLLLFERNAESVDDDQSVRLQSSNIHRGDTKAIVKLNFSAGIPSPVLEGTGKGQVTKAYRLLSQIVSLSSSGNSLKISLDIS
jgi:hypothetical protein